MLYFYRLQNSVHTDLHSKRKSGKHFLQMDYVLSLVERQSETLVMAIPGRADQGQCGSGRGIPCGCPIATGLRAGHPEGQARDLPLQRLRPQCQDHVITVDKTDAFNSELS
ncbi:hypothetical protein Desti_2835 [Desulfomonile tiedjei DSM 6799]|uniref:Uncharacterized protein n=1 Tax=Desulfomonile tiedjei (strain ATCC 49306 / DSM 6799 / DCB-1) TaxID=706587 RepID=I4C7G4_DESTA|nr:hypothetical protein Desti_2835 [Desulfomonile tiedjei DSM 6799]